MGVSERTIARYRTSARFEGKAGSLLQMLRFLKHQHPLNDHEVGSMRYAIGSVVDQINAPHPIEQQINAVGMPTPSAPGNYDAELAVLTDKLVTLYGREQTKGMLIGLLVSSAELIAKQVARPAAQTTAGRASEVGRASPPASRTPTPPTPPPEPPPQDTIIPQMLSAKISKDDDGKKHIVRVYGAGRKKP
jgi:hypothetical protein